MFTRHRTVIMFALIGAVNTLVDISIYATLQAGGMPILPANIISTSAALLLSFGLNKKFSFRSDRKIRQSLPLFIGVTLVGLWALQPLVIYGSLAILEWQPISSVLSGAFGSNETVPAVIGKLIATGASMAWNYLLYQKLVFRQDSRSAHSQAK
jgi:putative flippase GtrA